MATHAYRLRVYASTDENDTDFYATEITRLPDSFGAQRINVLEGRSESLNWTIQLNETQALGGGAWGISDQLADSDGHAHLLQRRVRLERQVSSTAAYLPVAGGRIVNIRQADDLSWAVEVADERWIERNTQTFTKANTATLVAPGRNVAWLEYSATPKITWRTGSKYYGSTGVVNTAVIVQAAGSSEYDLGDAISALKNDKEPGFYNPTDATVPAYNYARLKVEGGTTFDGEYQINYVGAVDNAAHDTAGIGALVVYDPGQVIPTNSTDFEGYIYLPDAPAAGTNVLHVGGSTGVHPFKFLRDLYDGAYQSTATSTGGAQPVRTIRYSTAALAALVGSPSVTPQRIWPRITKPETIAEAAERIVYRPLGYVPALTNDGAVKPVNVMLPTGDTVPSTTGLFEFNASNATVVPSWEHGVRDHVTAVNGTYYSVLDRDTEYGPAISGGIGFRTYELESDGLYVGEHTHYKQSPRLRAGTAIRRDLSIEVPGVWRADESKELINKYAADVFARYGDGPQYTRLTALSAASTVAVGDIVVVNVATFPNTYARQRGGRVVMQVTSRAVTPNGYSFDLMHVGPDLQPLSAPSVTLSRSGTDPKHTIDVVTAGGTTSDTVELQFARSSTAPNDSQWRTVATARPNQTVEVGDLRSGTKYYGRGRLTRANRIKSTWSVSDSTSTQAMTAPSNLASTAVGENWAQLTWTNGETNERVQVHNSTQGVVATLGTGSDRYRLRGLNAGYNYVFRVRHLDNFGGISAYSTACTVTTTTAGSTSGTILAVGTPTYLEIALGDDSLTSRVS